MNKIQGYIGTYASENSLGLYRFFVDVDTGELTKPQLYFQAENAKCLDLFHGYLAAPVESGGRAGMLLVEKGSEQGVLSHQVMEEKNAACFITHDENYLYTANYHQGHVLLYREERGRLIQEQKLQAGPKAGCHQVLLQEGRILVPCLELDKILIFHREGRRSKEGELKFPPGSGPRHGVFNRQCTRFYVAGERSCSLFCFQAESKKEGLKFRLMEELPLYGEKGADYAAAAVRLSPDERFLYLSVRGADQLIVVGLSEDKGQVLQRISSGGRHPRDFLLTPDGGFLLAVNRSSNELVSFPRDAETGLLGQPCSRAEVHEGVGILLERV